ncbi:MAG: elongation factor Ts [Proteobacteria bacterium]|nr:elongation factor Ts [Pseudomonadota bacterium]
MAAVTAQMVKELREATGAGMTDCKKALDEAQGDMDAALKVLRERGLAAAAKKSSRAASEGVVASVISNDLGKGYLVEVNCETDFVTRNEEFQAFVSTLQNIIQSKSPATLEALIATGYTTGGTVAEATTNLVAKIGENITVRRYATLGEGKNLVASYVHGGGKVGVLVELTAEGLTAQRSNPALSEIAKDVALQVAAMKPLYTNREAVPADIVKSESEVFWTQYKNQGKPEAALPKIVSSRMDTWHKENCLTEQMFVKDDSKTVAAYVADAGKQAGVAGLKVANFVRLELGQGVEKKSGDFAAEVAQQIAASSKN